MEIMPAKNIIDQETHIDDRQTNLEQDQEDDNFFSPSNTRISFK